MGCCMRMAIKKILCARSSIGIFVAFAIVVLCSPAFAHKVKVFAYAEEGIVFTESYFADGKPCKGSKISVEDPEGRVLVEGETDGEGLFSFEVPEKTDLKIVLNAGAGHRAEYYLKTDEMGDSERGKQSRSEDISVLRIIIGIFCIAAVMGVWMFLLRRAKRSG